MSNIFRKTAKGVHEIETREHRLPPRARNALILVDGKRDLDTLRALMPEQVADTLEMLLQQAFIEVIGDTVPTSAPRALPDAGIRLKPAPTPAAAPTVVPSTSAALPPFGLRQKTAVRELNDAIGPVGESLAIRMERARDEADLRQLVQMAVQLIGNARGRSAAESYAKRHEF